jgi:hypothetical protein
MERIPRNVYLLVGIWWPWWSFSNGAGPEWRERQRTREREREREKLLSTENVSLCFYLWRKFREMFICSSAFGSPGGASRMEQGLNGVRERERE